MWLSSKKVLYDTQTFQVRKERDQTFKKSVTR